MKQGIFELDEYKRPPLMDFGGREAARFFMLVVFDVSSPFSSMASCRAAVGDKGAKLVGIEASPIQRNQVQGERNAVLARVLPNRSLDYATRPQRPPNTCRTCRCILLLPRSCPHRSTIHRTVS